MELVYRVNFDIRNNDTDPFGRLKASSILSMMQDAATLQCRKLGVDGEALITFLS